MSEHAKGPMHVDARLNTGPVLPKTLTLSELTALKPCNLSARAALFDGDGATDIRMAFARGATVSDICWVMGASGMRERIVAFANFCADADAAADARAAAAAADAIESQKAELIRLIEESNNV